ncbi:MAG: BatD family protein [Myxococcaceae bacterium]|nr:BatD family protein [Myxococcaceae bacterium]
MARTGSALAIAWVLCAAAPALAAELEFYMTVDRNKVGTEDTFRCEIVVSNAPEGAVVQFPAPNDFEVLSRSESTQMSYSVGAGGMGQIKQVRKYTLVLRATRAGTLTIPAAGLQTASRTYKSEAIKLEVVPGRLAPDPRTQRRAPPQNPFGLPPGFPPGLFGDDDDTAPPGANPFDPFGDDEPSIPRSDSDLFLRASIDRPEVYVGEQVTLSLYIYSRIDLMGVDSVIMPKLEGFLAQDIASPTNLAPETRTLGGVPYRAYLLRSKALFPLKPGDVAIEPAESDISSGVFPFSGRKIHRKSNALTLKVKPLPAGAGNVGRWRLSSTVNQTDVALGEPVQLKLILEGRGNLKAVTLPKLEAPSALRVFDPQQTEKSTVVKNQVGGTRTVEYVLVPQQTGTFTVPGLTLEYFDPETQKVESSAVDPVTVTVRPSGTGAQATQVPTNGSPTEPSARNQLVGGGLKPLRNTATFSEPKPPAWSRPAFPWLALGPVALGLVLGAVALVRGQLGQEDAAQRRERQAKAARRRLAQAEKVSASGSTADFYAEVDKALRSFLEARLGQPVTGLTRPQLDEAMQGARVPDDVRARVLGVFETCDLGRYAPGMGDAAARRRALDDAAHAMEVWP